MSTLPFSSTSITDFNYPRCDAIMYLSVPKGYRGAAFISPLAKKYKYQDEILFHRNMRYKIASVEEVNGIFYIFGRVLTDEDT